MQQRVLITVFVACLSACMVGQAGTLYWANHGADGAWNNVINWHTDEAGTVHAANVPWLSGDSTYLGYDLAYATEQSGNVDLVDAPLAQVTGTCALTVIAYGGFDIYAGTWTGDYSSFNVGIIGGVYTGSSQSFLSVNGGTIAGANANAYGSTYGGTWTGDNAYLGADVFDGMYTGAGVTFSGGVVYHAIVTGSMTMYSNVYSGAFISPAITLQTSALVYGGIWSTESLTTYTSGIYAGAFWLGKGSVKLKGSTYKSRATFASTGGVFQTELQASDVLGSGLQ